MMFGFEEEHINASYTDGQQSQDRTGFVFERKLAPLPGAAPPWVPLSDGAIDWSCPMRLCCRRN
jgi:hypothetical protein